MIQIYVRSACFVVGEIGPLTETHKGLLINVVPHDTTLCRLPHIACEKRVQRLGNTRKSLFVNDELFLVWSYHL